MIPYLSPYGEFHVYILHVDILLVEYRNDTGLIMKRTIHTDSYHDVSVAQLDLDCVLGRYSNQVVSPCRGTLSSRLLLFTSYLSMYVPT